MKIDRIPFHIQILLVMGIGIALAVALDNIAIGIGVATAFFAGLVVRRNKIIKTSGENHE